MFSFALRGQARDIFAMFALGLLGAVLGMALPIASGRMVDASFLRRSMTTRSCSCLP
jgi:hypothetical protein